MNKREINTRIAKNINILLERNNMSIRQLSIEIGMSFTHLSEWLNNKSFTLKIENLIRICNTFNIRISRLVGLDLEDMDYSVNIYSNKDYRDFKRIMSMNFQTIRKYYLCMTLTEAGLVSDMSYQSFKNIERGIYTPSLITVMKLLSVTDISLEDFFSELDPEELILEKLEEGLGELSLDNKHKVLKLIKKLSEDNGKL